MTNTPPLDMTQAPLLMPVREVPAAWLDVNDHMNVAYYTMAFDQALDSVWEGLGIGEAYTRDARCGGMQLESHFCYLREMRRGDKFHVAYQQLEFDEKRWRYIMQMFNTEENYLAATCECLSIHVDLEARRASPAPALIYNNLKQLYAAHKDLPPPPQAGKSIQLKRPR